MCRERILRVALALFIAALAVRLVYLHEMRGSPFFDVLYPDALRYDGWAKAIAFGGEGELEPTFRAPLYPLFLAGIYEVAGHSLLAARLVQMVLGALSGVLTFLIARRLFGGRIAVASGLLWAFYGPAVYWAGEILIETLAVFLNLLAVYILIVLAERKGKLPWLVPGALMGLSAIARPNILSVAPFVIVWILFLSTHGTHGESAMRPAWRLRILRAFLFTLGLCLPITPVTIRNSRAAGDFIFISSQGGINFYMGNNALADGKTAAVPERGGIYGEYLDNAWVSSVRMAEASEGRELSAAEVSDFWYRKARGFIRENPLQWVRLMAAKLGFFWTGTEVTNNEDTYFFRRFSRTLSALMWQRGIAFPFGLVSPLAVAGMLFSLRRRRELSLAYGFILFYTISVILYFVCGRYRLPVVPFLLMFACAGFAGLVRLVRGTRWAQAVPALLLVAALGILANLDFGSVNSVNKAQAHYLCGWAFHQKEKLDEAAREYEEAVRHFPDHLQAHNNLGLIHARQGEYEEAIREFSTAVAIYPGDAKAHFYLGNAYLSAGMHREAAVIYEKVLDLDPGEELAAYRAGLAYLELGERERALEKWNQCLRINPGSRMALEALARYGK